MAAQDTLDSIEQHLSEAWDALEEMGASIPDQKNITNLAEAIRSL